MWSTRYIVALALLVLFAASASALVIQPLLSQGGSFIYSGFSFGNSAFGTGRF